MMKFFRKYNKQLLAFFMALLMIVFIGGTALQELLQPDLDFEIAKSNLGAISQQDQRVASLETEILDRMGQSWQYPLFSGNDPLTAMDWILLAREAEKLGVTVDDAAIRTNPNFGPVMENIRLVAHNMRIKQDVVIGAMAKLQSIRQAAITIASATTPSEAEIVSAARDSLERVKVRAVLLPAEAFVDANETFSEENRRDRGLATSPVAGRVDWGFGGRRRRHGQHRGSVPRRGSARQRGGVPRTGACPGRGDRGQARRGERPRVVRRRE